MITHLDPDVLACEVKWALGGISTNKSSGDDGIPIELFQIIKNDCVKVCQQVGQQIWKTQLWPQEWKGQFSLQRKVNAKESSNYHRIALTSHATKAMLKILQGRLQQYMNCEIPDVQAGFRKGRVTRDPLADIIGSSKKQESSRKTPTSALLTTPKPLTV